MRTDNIPEDSIELVAKYMNEKSSKNYQIPVIGNSSNSETPQVFEILPFDDIDNSYNRFYAIDGSYNSQQFYNGLAIGIYTAGYVCFQNGRQIKMNNKVYPFVKTKILRF
jgi:hypothetical protein